MNITILLGTFNKKGCSYLSFFGSSTRVCWLCIILGVNASYAQLGAFQTINSDPITRALGEATVARKGSPGAFQINPAAIGRLHTVQFGTNYKPGFGLRTPWLPSIYDNNEVWISNPYIEYKRGRWAAAYAYKHLDFGTREIRDAQNNPAGSLDFYDTVHKLAAAYDLNAFLTAGIGVNVIKLRLFTAVEGSSISEVEGVSVDLGIHYGSVWRFTGINVSTQAGWSLTDFGATTIRERREPFYTLMRGGVGFTGETDYSLFGLPAFTISFYGSLSKEMFRANDEGEFDSPLKALFTAWKPLSIRTNAVQDDEASITRLSTWDQMTKHSGVELSAFNILFYRSGRFSEHELAGNRNYSTSGWGIDLYYVAINYSKVRGTDSTLRGIEFWRLTTRIPLQRTADNFWLNMLEEFRRR